MELSLNISPSQHMTLTPQLQQAIKLLQLSTLDLQQTILELVETNPLLDIVGEENNTSIDEKAMGEDEFPLLFHYNNQIPSHRSNDAEFNYEQFYCATESLQEHLFWQLNLTPMSDIDKVIATTLIDAVDDNGFLTMSLDEIYTSLQVSDYSLEKDEIEAVRHLIQSFDPIGCIAINLQECLLIQIKHLDISNTATELAKDIITNHINLLAKHDYRQLRKQYHISEMQLQEALDVIHHLHPNPGSLIHQSKTEYIMPDVIVKKTADNSWKTFLNPHTLPRLTINQQYAALIQRANYGEDNVFLKNNLQEARWLLKSIQSRQDTLYRVAQCIVEHQQDFFNLGDEAMRPLTLSDIASRLELHESTISRITTQKYLLTPRGIFELKYFFSSHVQTINGGECSSTAIRAVIKKLITLENPNKPLSDDKLTQLIVEQGICVARRTIAKYREELGIPPSHERKSLQK